MNYKLFALAFLFSAVAPVIAHEECEETTTTVKNKKTATCDNKTCATCETVVEEDTACSTCDNEEAQ